LYQDCVLSVNQALQCRIGKIPVQLLRSSRSILGVSPSWKQKMELSTWSFLADCRLELLLAFPVTGQLLVKTLVNQALTS